jgi:membrane-bound ClpP family serine protease
MSTGDWLCVLMIILGVILFLVGSNIYNGGVGWVGVLLFVAGIAGLILLFVYNMMRRHGEKSS